MRTHTNSLLEKVRDMEPDEVLEIRFAKRDEGVPSQRLVCHVKDGMVWYRLSTVRGEMNSVSESLGNLLGAKEMDLMLPKKAVRGWQAEVYHWVTFLGYYEIISIR